MKGLNTTIALGIVAALLGSGIVLAYGRNVEERIADGKETVEVLVASEDLLPGAGADELGGAVGTKLVPRAYVTGGAVESLDDVRGQILTSPVAAGTQLSAAQFAEPGEVRAVAPSEGHVAVAVEVDLSPGVARYVQSGSTVDVFVTYDNVGAQERAAASASATGVTVASERKPGRASNRTKLFATDVRVLSVAVAASTDGGEDVSAPADSVVAVLDVSPAEAERIVNATTLGELYLALSRGGELHRTRSGVTPADVVKANRR